jgi:hypothetical protein
MECTRINVQGESASNRGNVLGGLPAPKRHLGTRAEALSPEYVNLPGAYKGVDPGVKFQLYWPKSTNCTIPGPRPLVC